jgi:hypothetical protein
MRYGIFDIRDRCWLGNTEGPKTFGAGDVVNGRTLTEEDAHTFARISAQMSCVQLGVAHTRLEARPYHVPAILLKDEVKTKMTPERALRLIERGEV